MCELDGLHRSLETGELVLVVSFWPLLSAQSSFLPAIVLFNLNPIRPGIKQSEQKFCPHLVLSPTYALIYIIKILSQAITLVALFTPTCFDPYGSS